MRVTKSVRCEGLRKIKPFASGSLAAGLTTVLLSVVSSVLATLAPMNKYMMLLGNEALMRGQWQEIVPLLAGYIFFSMWPLWFVWVFLSIKNLSPSLSKIVCAAIFFTASSCMILIFK